MLDHNETAELLKRAKEGDAEAKEKLIVHNTPLLKSIIKRFCNKGVEYDDPFSSRQHGLHRPIKNFNFSFNVKFSTYAVPMIAGEIRDSCGRRVHQGLALPQGALQQDLQICRKPQKGGKRAHGWRR